MNKQTCQRLHQNIHVLSHLPTISIIKILITTKTYIASHADILSALSRVPLSRVLTHDHGKKGAHDKALRTST